MARQLILMMVGLLVLSACVQQAPLVNDTVPVPPPAPPSGDGRFAAIDCPADHPKGDGPCTLEYNPVCADGTTYGNVCQACRVVDRYFQGECSQVGNDTPPPAELEGYVECTEEQRNQPCTKEYNPVCATKDNGIRCITTPCDSTDQVTAGNACTACSDPLVYGYVPGACAEETNNSGKQGTHLICENGECRDVNGCPEGYDEFRGQIKMMCVRHANETDVRAWPTCVNSKTCATDNCIFATRTTDGKEIDWGGLNNSQGLPNNALRCVPEDYKNYLMQTTAASGMDKDGQFFAVIA